MGYAIPAMLGAGMAHGSKPFVGIESDGSLMFNVQELLTLKEFKVPVRIFIMNNKGYASIRTTQRNYFKGRYIGTGPEGSLLLPDIVAVSEVLGIPAIRINDASEMREKIRYTLAQPGPFICDIALVKDEALWPKCAAMPQPDGSMLSMPLEDMTPLLSREQLRENMIVPLDPVSLKVQIS
jgi:acetolactate synthase-1/2/3 large subunit